jgi:WD40 repeat protein
MFRVAPHTTIAGNGQRVQAVAFSGDGRCLAVSQEGEKVFRVRDLPGGTERCVSQGHPGLVSALAFDHDGRHILSASSRGYVSAAQPRDPALIRVSDARSGRVVREFHGRDSLISRLASVRDGTSVALYDDEVLQGWNLADWSEVFSIRVDAKRRHRGGLEVNRSGFGVSDDGRHAVSVSTAREIGGTGPERTVTLWDIGRKTSRVLNAEGGVVRSVAISPDGSCVLTATADCHVSMFEFDTGRRRFAFVPLNAGIDTGPYLVAFDPEGSRFVTGKKDGLLRMDESKQGRHIDTIRGPRTYVRSVAFLSDRLRVVSGGYAETGFTKQRGVWVTNYEPLWVWDAVIDRAPDGREVFQVPRG